MRAENVAAELSRKCNGYADFNMSCKRGYILGIKLQNLYHTLADAMVWGKKDVVRYAACS